MPEETAAGEPRGSRLGALVRAGLGLACLAAQLAGLRRAGWPAMALAAGFLAYGLGVLLLGERIRGERGALFLLLTDTVFYLVWVSLAGPNTVWVSAALYCYLVLCAALLHTWRDAVVVAGAGTGFHLIVAPPQTEALWPSVLATGVIGLILSHQKRLLEGRLSQAAAEAESARAEAGSARNDERRRVAADLHDGPLQSFISFQVRLEVLRKMLERTPDAARTELVQLQELWRSQIAELRSFLRSMRPAEVEAANLAVSLRRLVESFKKDSGIPAGFVSDDVQLPSSSETAVEVIQILREALNNAQKHSKASRVAVAMEKTGRTLSLSVSDDGTGFSFSGPFTLDELERLRMGPASIKQRVRKLGGELVVNSRPGRGVELSIRVPL